VPSFLRQRVIYFILATMTAVVATHGICAQAPAAIGLFEQQQDIGIVLRPGSANYDSVKKTYTVSSAGETMWVDMDEFHFVWKQVSGDVSLSSDIELQVAAGMHNPHRKAVLMIRQSLDSHSAYVDIAVHGVGKSALQFRSTAGAGTHTIAANIYAPRRLKIVKHGDEFFAFISGKDGRMQFAGSSTKLHLTGPFYVGLGVCSHEKDIVETAIFSNVKLTSKPENPSAKTQLYSTIETVTVGSPDRQVEYTASGRLEAPNWSKDGLFFVYNREGGLYRLPVKCGGEDTGCAGPTEPLHIPTDPARTINNDHGLSSNGRIAVISDNGGASQLSQIYTVPIVGGKPVLLTPKGPSYFHSWSPDGKTIAFTGKRDGSFGIFTMPAEGGEETRLTTAKGLDDGPDYSHDGKFIYFNSDRTGSMQIWRMHLDGSQPEQVVTDEFNDWFPHPSPDGTWVVFLAYDKDVTGHPADKDVKLFSIKMKDQKVEELATLFGGQGTINVPSWSPDGKKVAFVSYKYVPLDAVDEK
jgi:TolB protein